LPLPLLLLLLLLLLRPLLQASDQYLLDGLKRLCEAALAEVSRQRWVNMCQSVRTEFYQSARAAGCCVGADDFQSGVESGGVKRT
jgi:hypothetical protein